MKYSDAIALLGNRETRKIANNTYLIRQNDAVSVRLHQTNIITLLPDNSARIDSGGYRTATTKDRINRFSPVRVNQVRGAWLARSNNGQEFEFSDGMLVSPTGLLIRYGG